MADTTPGTIIVLNGCASAGKTSIAKAIQRTFPDPYLHLGIDLFWLEVLPWEWAGAGTDISPTIPIEGASPPKSAVDLRPFGRFAISGLHRAIAALAAMGHNVVVDQVFYDAGFITEILALWEPLPVWLVGVSCPFETVRRRAAARPDRESSWYLPVATWMFDEAHRHTRGIYDLEVDTSRSSPTECALQVKRMLDGRASPTALKRLAAVLQSA